MFKQHKKKCWMALTLFVCVGSYNAVVINMQSFISPNAHYIKGLDEMYGINTPGRHVANRQWQKVAVSHQHQPMARPVDNHSFEPLAPEQEAAIQDSLSLQLVEVSNPEKWKQGLTANEFEGKLSTSNGVLEDFAVSLPSGEEIAVSFMEMNGNVFNYDLNGEIYSAMIFQADQHSYLVTLTNGPLEGTRMRFKGEGNESQQVAAQESLSEKHNIEAGNFGEDEVRAQQSAGMEVNPDLPLQVHAFNFEQQVL